MCDLVIVLHEKRLIEIIEYPTIKIERKYAHLLSNFEERLKKYTEKDKGSIKYNITKQISEDGFFYITLRELENPKILEILVHEFNQEAP